MSFVSFVGAVASVWSHIMYIKISQYIAHTLHSHAVSRLLMARPVLHTDAHTMAPNPTHTHNIATQTRARVALREELVCVLTTVVCELGEGARTM